MFGTIRKHQNWLWLIIIAVIIVSFVIFFTPNAMQGGRGGSANYGVINGERISREQLVNAQRDLELLYFFFLGGQDGHHWPDATAKARGFDIDKEQYKWLLLLQEQQKMGIHVSSETAGQFAREMLAPLFRGAPVSVPEFVKQVLVPHGLTMEDLDRFCRHFLGRQQLANVVGLSGKLVTPEEVKQAYVREFQELNTKAAFFSASNYLSSVTVTPQALSQFYSNQLANYRIPARVQVSYVKFGVSNYLNAAQSQLTNLNEQVESTLQRLGTNYTHFGATTNEAKVKLREEIVRAHAMNEAKRAASALTETLLDIQTPHPEDIAKVAKTNGLTVQVSQPFDENTPPANLQVGPDFASAAFKATPEEPFAGPVAGEDGYYVIALAKQIPSEIPPLSQVKERVTADYKYRQAWDKARQAGQAFEHTLTNAIAQGKSFDAACAAAGVKPVELPPFAMSTRSLPGDIEERVNLNTLKQLAFGTPVGKASHFQATREGGLILAVTGKVPLPESQIQEDLPAYTHREAQRRQEEAFNIWFQQQAQRGLGGIPVFQQPPPAPNMSANPASGKRS